MQIKAIHKPDLYGYIHKAQVSGYCINLTNLCSSEICIIILIFSGA